MMNGMDAEDGFCQLISEWPVVATETRFHGNQANESSYQQEVPVNNLSPTSDNLKKQQIISGLKRKFECDPSFLEKEVNTCTKEPLANTSIAKWWRRHGQYLMKRTHLPHSTNANTRLSAISRSKAGKDFIQEEIKRLGQLLCEDEMRADIHAALGSFLERYGHYEEAKVHLQRAVLLDPQDQDYRWLMFKVKKQIQIQKCQTDGLKQLKSKEATAEMKPFTPVQRISADDLSFKDFLCKYALTSTPVVITDIVSKMTNKPWTLDHIKQKAGNCMATVKKFVPESAEWARLEDFKTTEVADFIDHLEDCDGDDMYLFDWSLPLHCPQLAQELTIPKYFASDFLQRTSPGSLYKDSWPSLFIAPAGMTSELHVDAFGSNFWMALFEGKKRWVFFPRKDLPFLYPRYEYSMDPVFEVDLDAPDLDKYPLLSLTEPLECVLQSGDLLFVPAGCPHRVQNLEKSLAISANFVDLSNLELVKQELSINGVLDQRAEDLYKQLTNENFITDMCSNLQDLNWSEFKNWCFDKNDSYDIPLNSLKQ